MKEFKVVHGVQVTNLEGIFECYSISHHDNYSLITLSVSADNICSVFLRLVKEVKIPGFLLLEHGTNRNIENQLRKTDADPLHKDIYYLDGLDLNCFIQIFEEYQELLINDGVINFGFGSHSGFDEVYVGSYKIFYIYSNELVKYETALNELGIPKVAEIKTVWQTFTEKTPGNRRLIKVNGTDIYEMIERLKEKGLYFAERRED